MANEVTQRAELGYLPRKFGDVTEVPLSVTVTSSLQASGSCKGGVVIGLNRLGMLTLYRDDEARE